MNIDPVLFVRCWATAMVFVAVIGFLFFMWGGKP